MADYKKISDDLIANAKDYPQVQLPDEKTILNSVRRLSESPEGGLSFVDATSNICGNTRNKLIAILKWICDNATSKANFIDELLKYIKPLVLVIIGFIVSIILAILRGHIKSDYIFSWQMQIIAATVIYFLIWQLYLIYKKKVTLDISIKSSSLIEIVKSET